MRRFVKDLNILARDFYERKQAHILFTGRVSVEDRDNKEKCWICEDAFYSDDEFSLHHCHFPNKILG